VTDPRTALVAAGYDAMIDTWETWKAQITDDPRADWCDELVARLPRGGRVVELGCGGGTDETRLLAERFRLTAIDLSAEHLRRARERVPEAAFLHGDIAELELEHDELVTIHEPEGEATFHWVLATR